MLLVGEKRKTQEQIKAIMEEYGLEDFVVEEFQVYDDNVGGYVDDFVTASQRMVDNIYSIKHYDELEPEYDKCKQIAELIQFLRVCKGNPIELRGTITAPKGGMIKGAGHSITIKEELFPFGELDSFLNTFLHDYYDIIEKPYKQETWPFDKKHPYFRESYTDEELSEIIAFSERIEKKRTKLTNNGELGSIARHIIKYIQPEAAKLKFTKTKLYSFIYDVMLLGKPKINQSYTSREKFQAVTNWIDAYKRSKKKADKKATQKED